MHAFLHPFLFDFLIDNTPASFADPLFYKKLALDSAN
jgi:hypothetical protein